MELSGYDDWKTTPPDDVDLDQVHHAAKMNARGAVCEARRVLMEAQERYKSMLGAGLGEHHDEEPPYELVEAAKLLAEWLEGKK